MMNPIVSKDMKSHMNRGINSHLLAHNEKYTEALQGS